MFRVGLTGGIASGKSVVAERFAELGVCVVDTDVISRELVLPGAPALAELVGAFGSGILRPSGELDRSALATRVFGDEPARRRLNTILHPRIRAEMLRQADGATGCYVLLVVPLMVETGQHELVDHVLLITSPADIRAQRLAARDNLSGDEIERRLAAQTSDEMRAEHADDIINNVGTLARLFSKVDALHRKLRVLAGC